MDEYYKILGLRKGADKETIKRAYRKKAMELHPDRNKASNAHEQFVEVTLAYDVLINGRKVRVKAQQTRTPEEKFKNVYNAPTDPKEYQDWLRVAKQRAAEQARMRFENFRKNNEAFRRSKYFWVAKLFSFSIYLAGLVVSLGMLLTPVILGVVYKSSGVFLVSAVFFFPMCFWIYRYTADYKKSYNLYFGD